MAACSRCSGPIEAPFRYCPWCAAPQRLKLVEFFRPHERIEVDRGRSLRVSRYVDSRPDRRHVRFSVWNDAGDRAEAEVAISLDEDEAWRLSQFLRDSAEPRPAPGGMRAAIEQLRAYVRALR